MFEANHHQDALDLDSDLSEAIDCANTETTQYDPNFGRPVRKEFPAVTGITAQSIYMGYTLGGDPMQTGFAASYLPSDPRSSNATRYLRRDEGTNARGQMLSSRFGSGDQSQAYQWLVSEYDAATGWLLSRCSGITICSGVAQSGSNIDTGATMKLGYEYDVFGNVSKSVNVGKRPGLFNDDVRLETFGYDALHRMTSAKRDGAVTGIPAVNQVNYSYSPVGNLWSKSDFASAYNYGLSAPKHGVKTVLLNSGLTQTYGYDENGNVTSRSRKGMNPETFGYDIDNRPQWTKTVSATATGSETRIDFYLSAKGAKAIQIAAGPQPRVVIYAGAYEAEYTGPTLTASRTYLAEGVLHNGAGLQQGLSFMHQDRLGSALVITDKGGAILDSDGAQAEFRTFDPFGKARDNKGLDTLNGRLFATNPNGKRNRKGFTGHEHLDEAGLIHMEGRAYDYNLGRFYGVDPVIQFPTNSQSLNGYSYLMNNPLAGTDPTGYSIEGSGGACQQLGIDCKLNDGLFARFSLSAGAGSNGASGGQANTPKSRTDGAKGGASEITARPKYDASNTPTLDATEVIGSNPESRARVYDARMTRIDAWQSSYYENRNARELAIGKFLGMATASTAVCVATAGGCAVITLGAAASEASYGNYKTAGVLGILSVLPAVGPVRAMMREGGAVAGEIKVASTPLATRVEEFHSVLDPIATKQRTTAAIDTQEGLRVIGSGVRDLSPAQRALIQPGEAAAKLSGAHAEVTLLQYASQNFLKPTALEVSRTICQGCQAAIEQAGGRLTSSTTAVWPR